MSIIINMNIIITIIIQITEIERVIQMWPAYQKSQPSILIMNLDIVIKTDFFFFSNSLIVEFCCKYRAALVSDLYIIDLGLKDDFS